jgi:hypothetical protein
MAAATTSNQLGGGMGNASSMSSMSGTSSHSVISAGHMSSLPNMNNTFAANTSMPSASTASTNIPTVKASSTPSMSFAQMQSQSVEMEGNRPIGGTRRGEAPMTLPAPGTITNESITAISAGRYKTGTLGAYQKQSVSEMRDAGRTPEFIISHLNQATAAKIPNYNLPADQAKKAFAMAGSGRTQSFIRGKLGLHESIPVPGRDAASN